MLTYHQVLTTDLTQLTTAADKWDAMAEELKKVEGRYGDSVQKITMGPDWLGASALVAHDSFTGTRYEYSAAQIQAKAIAGLLRDAHEQFTDLRNRVESARDKAVQAGMTVSEGGQVAFDFSRLTPAERSAYHHDPDGEASIRKAVTEWQQRIDDGVKAVSEADQGVKIALDAVVVDSNKDAFGGDQTSHGFNADAQGDIEVYEARNAQSIATRINSGGNVSAAEYAELDRSFRDNAKSQEFSQTFLNGMGAENTLKLANKLNDHAYGDDKGNKQRYLDVEKGLANSLSNAMQDPRSAFYQDFRTQLKHTGAQQFDLKQIGDSPQIGTGHGQKVRGYQSLVTLMQNGDGYSAPFMRDLADDIRTAEDKKRGGNPDVWDLTSDFSGRNKGWFANDPLDGLLGIMSKDPAAAASYLDPGPDGKNDNLPYLLKDRDWNHVDTTTWTGNIERTGSDTFDKDVRAGLGLALEAATTGHPAASPGTELGRHSEAEARIMHDTVNLLDYGDANGKDDKGHLKGQADNVLKSAEYANLRGPLARALSSYSPDIVDIIAGDGPGGLVGAHDARADGDHSQIQNSRSSLLRVLRGASEDPENYFLLHESERRYMAEQITTENLSDPEAVKNRAAKIGEVNGAINAIGGDVHLSERDLKVSTSTDQRVYGYHVIGGAVTGLPVVGDLAQRVVDGCWNEWLKGVTAEEGLLARERISSGNDSAQQDLNQFFKSWGDKAQQPNTMVEAAQREARQSYTSGRESAYDALRDRK
ncbi:hypothetical protein BX286_4660 [Streptomyces sp. 3211.6]|uniref:DUF6571 family protein n=1 Tax=Streptomyces sp. 3211.6 TaxID=1938845 RepID=UPI000F21E6CE|nr:DUF6571 family protein [Streptomyces sp. 3211.6]RKT06615.1 hypothetical protein BX286_4660 [Streptomyces sp. 3211.6]